MRGRYPAGLAQGNPGDHVSVGDRLVSRAAAVGALAAGVAAGTVAVTNGLGGSGPATVAEAKAADATITSHFVRFGHDRVSIQVRPSGLVCFLVKQGTSTVARSCASHVYADEIAYASSRYAVGGLAGKDVKAVIVKLTKKGTVWADVKGGTFYAKVPKAHRVRAVVKVLRNGSRKTFTVTTS